MRLVQVLQSLDTAGAVHCGCGSKRLVLESLDQWWHVLRVEAERECRIVATP